MRPFEQVTGIVAPLLRNDVDTDTIIPAAFMRSLSTDPAEGLFARWRFRPDGTEAPGFVLNDPPFRCPVFLLAGRNFGCGSSRENAVWALAGFGIRGVVALGFSDIFRENALKNGLLPMQLAPHDHARLADAATREPTCVTVDVSATTLTLPDGTALGFPLAFRQQARLLRGQDEIDETLAQVDRIDHFLARHRARFPWLYAIEHVPERA